MDDKEQYTVTKIQAEPKPPAPRLRQTHTVVELPVTPESYAEIKYLLTQAGYDHCFMDGGGIDLSGIALTRKEA